jgi:hypothetical protein
MGLVGSTSLSAVVRSMRTVSSTPCSGVTSSTTTESLGWKPRSEGTVSSTSDSVRTVRRVGAEALMSPEMGRGRPTWQIARRPVDGDGPVPVVDDVTTLGGTMSNPWSPPQLLLSRRAAGAAAGAAARDDSARHAAAGSGLDRLLRAAVLQGDPRHRAGGRSPVARGGRGRLRARGAAGDAGRHGHSQRHPDHGAVLDPQRRSGPRGGTTARLATGRSPDEMER